MTQPNGSQIRNTIVYLVTIIATQASSFALLPLVTRFLGPESFGIYSLALAVSGLVGTFASSWLRNVAFRYYFDAREEGRTRSFFWSLAVFQAAAVVVAFGITAALLPLLSREVVPPAALWSSAAMVVTSDFMALALAFVRAEQLSGRFAAAETTAALTRLIGTAAGLLVGFTQPSFLLLAAAGASAIGGWVAMVGLSKSLTGRGALSFGPIVATSRHVFGALPFSVGAWIGSLSDRLVLNAFTSAAVVGIYSAGYSLGDRLIGGLASAVYMMAWPDILDSWSRGGRDGARVAVRRYFQIYLWFTGGPLIAVLVFGSVVVNLLGPSFAEALQVVGLVACAAWLNGLSTGFNRHFELEKRYYGLSLLTIAGALINLALNFVLIPLYEGVGAGISAVAARSLLTVVYVVLRDKRLVSFPMRDALYVALTCALGVGVTSYLLGITFVGLMVFALLYTLALAFIWTARMGKLPFASRGLGKRE